MDFLLTPEEAQSTALAVMAHLRTKRHAIEIEASVDPSISFRPTITATKSGLKVYVEAQHNPAYTEGVRELVHSVSVERSNCEVYVAVPDQATLTGDFLMKLKRDRVGLLVVDSSDAVTVHMPAGNPALIVTPDPTLKFGPRSTVVKEAVDKFNEGERKAALQHMCEIVEGETEAVLEKLVTKGHTTLTREQVAEMDWSSRINAGASPNRCAAGHTPIFDDKLKNDLHSFRGARNLMNHAARTAAERRARDAQFAERILMGPRLVHELARLLKSIR